jgi:LPXTG-motif cell wall-anchored protein
MVKRVIALAVVLVGLMAAPAAAQQYPPATNSITVSDTTPTPGQTVTVTAQTFLAGAEVTVTLFSAPVQLASAQADGNGVVTVDVTIPANTPLGDHTIVASGQAVDGVLELTAAITVVPAGSGATGAGDLPRTGDDTSIPLAKLGIALAAVGGVITAFAAKRRKAAAAV